MESEVIKLFEKMFELINKELNLLINDATELELKKIEIRENKVKFVFLNNEQLAVKVINYELDLLGPEPRLKHKNDYLKPYTDKYFR